MLKNKTLPNLWTKTTVSAISALVTKGTTPTTIGFKYQDSGGILFVKVESIYEQKINHEKCAFISEGAHSSLSRSQLKKDDVLISIAGTIGRVAIVSENDIPANTNQALAIIRPTEAIESKFLAYSLESLATKKAVASGKKGVGLQNLNLKQISELEILLPPFPEQKRIADNIGLLQSRSKSARNALEAIPPLLEKFRQSVLSAAFRGDLTADWRAQNPDIEPAEKLLERIRKERRKRWEENELAKMKARGKEPKNDKWKKKYKEPEPVDTTNLPELPVGWCWAALEELGAWLGGGTPSKSILSYWANGTIPWVSPKDMKSPVIMETVDYITEKALQDSTSNLFPEGTILIVTRSGILRRTLPIALAGVDLAINQDLKGLKLEGELRPVYVFEALNSFADSIREQCAKAGTTVESIVFDSLLKFPIPIAPQKEQVVIAEKLGVVNEKMEIVKNNCASSLLKLSYMDSSILSKAFRGELVPQDPNDEPASQLLKRIRQEKATLEAGKKKKGKVTRKGRR